MSTFDDCVIFLLAKAYQRAHTSFKKQLLPHGLTPIQYLILEALWEEEGVSAGEIGKKLVLDNATLSGVLDRMVDKGWVRKETDIEDKRALRVFLTDKSKGLESTLRSGQDAANKEILSKLTLEEKVLLKRLLKDIRG